MKSYPKILKAITTEYPDLNRTGFGADFRRKPDVPDAYAFTGNRQEASEFWRSIIYLSHFNEIKSWQKDRSSYGLKHDVEYFSRIRYPRRIGYVSNGVLILALIHSGFKIKRGEDPRDPNVYANASIPASLRRELTGQNY